MSENYYPFQLLPIQYAYISFEPYIDVKTMQIHHNNHLRTKGVDLQWQQ